MSRYPALVIIATFFRVVGVLCITGGIFGALFALSAGVEDVRLMVFATYAGAPLLSGILFLAMGESTKVIVDIEENTRVTAASLAGLSPGTSPGQLRSPPSGHDQDLLESSPNVGDSATVDNEESKALSEMQRNILIVVAAGIAIVVILLVMF